MKKKIVLVCCFLLLITSGCSVKRITLPVHNATIIMDRNSSDILQDAMGLFCTTISARSGGSLRLSVSYSDNAPKDFKNKQGEFLFEDSRNTETLDASLRHINAPFLYRNYNHFTMSIHSNRVLSLLSPSLMEQISARPLAAFFRGNTHLLSTHPVVTENDMLYLTDSSVAPEVLLASSPVTSDYFKAAGFEPSIVPNVTLRKEILMQEPLLFAEFTTSELTSLSWSNHKLYHSPTFHTVNMQLLLVDEVFYQSLSPEEQRLISEELSYLYPIIEDYYILRENIALGKLKEQGVTMSSSPLALWRQVDRSAAIIRSYDDFEEIALLIYERIREISKTITE